MSLKKKSIKKIIALFVCVLYSLSIVMLCRNTAIDSDKANHLLQAQDIINGNFFFKDWNLTGVTFFTTDLLYYDLAYLLCGIRFGAIYVAGGLMISSAMIMSYFVAFYNNRENTLLKKVLFFLWAMIPCQSLIFFFRVHTGAVTLCLISYILVLLMNREDYSPNRKRLFSVMLFVVCLFGTIGDMLMIIEGVLAILSFCLYKVIIIGVKNKKRYIKTSIVVICGTVLGLVIDKIYFFIGGANKNSYIMEKSFTPAYKWGEKLWNFIDNLMVLGYSDFDGNIMSNVNNGVKIFFFIMGSLSLLFAIKVMVQVFQKKNCVDDVSVIVALGICFSFACYLFTDMAYARYITIIPLGLIIIFIRNIDDFLEGIFYKKIIIAVAMICSIIGAVLKCHEIISLGYPESNNRIYELIAFLENHNLEYGYASFWNSSNITVLSEDKVKIRHITKNGNIYELHDWFNKNIWYKEKSKFILINNEIGDRGENDLQGVNEGDVIKYFGVPSERYEFEGYIILVYDTDLSLELGQPRSAIDDGLITADELCFSNCSINEGIIEIKDGGIVYGPYAKITEGNYRIEFIGENLSEATCDIWTTNLDMISYSELEHTDTSIVLDLQVYKEIDDIEFRTFASNEHVILKKILLDSLQDK